MESTTELLVKQLAKIVFTLQADGIITSASENLLHHLPGIEDKALAAVFDVVRPSGAVDFASLQASAGAAVLLVASDNSFAIRGQFVSSQELPDSLVFVGAPWLSWITQNTDGSKLRLDDFSATDVQLDQLIFLSTEQENSKDLQLLTEELKVARDKAEQANKVQAEFFALMSHEMRTPLNGISSALDLINGTPLSYESGRMLQIARSSSVNLKRVVDQVLNYSKLQAGGFSHDPRDFDLTQTLNAVMDLHTPFAQDQSTHLGISNAAEQRFFTADEPKIRQILINLVGNALKFTTVGTVSLCSEYDEAKQQLIFKVIDTGEGISAASQAKIFETYWCFDAKDGGSRGTGLGLNICKKFVDIMSGSITFESTEGSGTVFEVRIPAALANSADGSAELSNEQAYFAGKVLLVEDNKTNLLLAELMLQKRGLNVDVATNGVEAIAQVDANDYDLVIMDVSMPEMSGVEATEALRKHYNDTQLPIVAMTAHANEEDHNRFKAAGMNSVLSKPIDIDRLNSTLATYCETAEAPLEEVELTEKIEVSEYIDAEAAAKLEQEVGAEVYCQVAAVFHDEAVLAAEAINLGFANQHGDVMAKKSHAIRSSAATLGCTTLAERLSNIEQSAKADDWDSLAKLMSGLDDLFTQTLHALKAHAASLS